MRKRIFAGAGALVVMVTGVVALSAGTAQAATCPNTVGSVRVSPAPFQQDIRNTQLTEGHDDPIGFTHCTYVGDLFVNRVDSGRNRTLHYRCPTSQVTPPKSPCERLA